MFFHKTRKENERVSFMPSKLSQEALDNFVKKYTRSPHPHCCQYTTKEGGTVTFDANKVIDTLGAIDEFLYFLGQTRPYHITTHAESFPITQLAYIINETGQFELWTNNPKVLSQFVTIGNSLSRILLKKTGNTVTFTRIPSIKAVVHKES